MARILNGRHSGETVSWRIWLRLLLTGLSASLILSLLSLPGPQVGQVAGVISPAAQGLSGFLALLRIEPNLKLVDLRWGGRLIFVVSQRKDFPQLARRHGALLLFDAKAVGCVFNRDGGGARP